MQIFHRLIRNFMLQVRAGVSVWVSVSEILSHGRGVIPLARAAAVRAASKAFGFFHVFWYFRSEKISFVVGHGAV